MVQERNECNCPLEVNVVLPKRVIGIDEQRLSAVRIRAICHPLHDNFSCSRVCNERSRIDRSAKIGTIHDRPKSLSPSNSSVCSYADRRFAEKVHRHDGSAAKPSQAASLKVTPDLGRRLAKFRSVETPLRATGLTATERKMVNKLVEACQFLEGIFWRQMDPEALSLYQSLAGSTNPRDIQLRRYLWINASRFDLIDDNKPFVGKDAHASGAWFLSAGLDSRPDRKICRRASREESRTLQPIHRCPLEQRTVGGASLPYRLSIAAGTRGQGAAGSRQAE